MWPEAAEKGAKESFKMEAAAVAAQWYTWGEEQKKR